MLPDAKTMFTTPVSVESVHAINGHADPMISNLSILLGDWNAIRPEFGDALAALIRDAGPDDTV